MNFALKATLCLISLLSLTAEAYQQRPFIIAVAGGSASGKTYVAKLIAQALGEDRTTLISADNYYAPEKQALEFYRDGSINFDHPSAVDLKKLAWHLGYLRSGFPVQIKEYTYGRKVDQDKWLEHPPREFILVEGIFALYSEIADLVDYRIFVDVDQETRFKRRLERDQKERGLSEAAVREYFETIVEPMHARYVQPSALRADQIVESPNDREKLNRIVQEIQLQAQKQREVKSAILESIYNRDLQLVLSESGDQFSALDIQNLFPSQEHLGFLNLSYKSMLIDSIVKETALAVDQPSKLAEYLRANPVPFTEVDGRLVVLDHHHLIYALFKKGIGRFLGLKVDISQVDPERLALIRKMNPKMRIMDLENNPYRSLAGLVRDLGYVVKTGQHHEEFAWADYYQARFEKELKISVTEQMLLSTDEREPIVKQAIAFASDPAAQKLPGFIGGSRCENGLIGN